jgi:hypothetical protein
MNETVRTIEVTFDDLRQLAGEQRLYAVLDACDAPEVFGKVRELGPDRAFCLYRGEISQETEEDAPYLTSCDESILQWLIEAVWNTPWGIFVVARIEPKRLLKHLRRFLVVQDPDGEPVYFRYYDPRVLPTFLSACNKEELETILGPSLAFGFNTPGQGASLVQRAW